MLYIVQSRVKLVFHQLTFESGLYISRKLWYDSIWQKVHNMQQPPLDMQLSLYIARLRAVSMGQVMSKDAPCS